MTLDDEDFEKVKRMFQRMHLDDILEVTWVPSRTVERLTYRQTQAWLLSEMMRREL
jgi:hypothetical protein